MNDTVRFDVSAPRISWGVDVDLTESTIRAWKDQRSDSGTLSPHQVARLRELITPLHAGGSHRSRSQFASGSEVWTICLGGETVTVSYEDETTVSPRDLWRWVIAARDRLL